MLLTYELRRFRDGFTVQPHLEDMARLNTVSQHREIAKTIRRITFIPGETSIERLIKAVRRQSKEGNIHNLKKVWEIIKRAYGTNLYIHCNKHLLDQILPRLSHLSVIKVDSVTNPFVPSTFDLVHPWVDFHTFWKRRQPYVVVKFQDPQLSVLRYGSILLAARGKNLTELVLSQLPIDTLLVFNEEQQLTIA